MFSNIALTTICNRIGLILYFTVFVTIGSASAQTEGIQFENEASWREIVAKASRENKYIFVDCYASWCAPCKWMSKNIFPKKEVGDFFNANFINVVIRLDEPVGETDASRQRAIEAKEMEQKYNIKTLPTYLFFAPDGTPVHKMATGAIKNEKIFISQSRDALEPSKQYYTIIKNYSQHARDSVYLHNALSAMLAAKDSVNSVAVSALYQDAIKDPFRKEAITIIYPTVTSSASKGFLMLVNNAAKIGSILGEDDRIDWVVSKIISKEELSPLFNNPTSVKNWEKIIAGLKKKYPGLQEKSIELLFLQFDTKVKYYGLKQPLYASKVTAPNWKVIETKLVKQYPGMDISRMVTEEKPKFYGYTKNWQLCAQSAIAVLNQYGAKLRDREINNMVWNYVFKNSDDKVLLERALYWSKRTVEMAPNNYQNLDTYANLLYKLGNKDQAIENENKAIELIENSTPKDTTNLKELQEAKRKMINGEPTWVVQPPLPAV